MKHVTVNTETVCLTNGIIWRGYQPAPDPEECDPLWIMWQHWEHTAEWKVLWENEARFGSERDDRAFEAEADYRHGIGEWREVQA